MQQHYPEIYARMYDDKLEGKLTPERMKYYATLVKQAQIKELDKNPRQRLTRSQRALADQVANAAVNNVDERSTRSRRRSTRSRSRSPAASTTRSSRRNTRSSSTSVRRNQPEEDEYNAEEDEEEEEEDDDDDEPQEEPQPASATYSTTKGQAASRTRSATTVLNQHVLMPRIKAHLRRLRIENFSIQCLGYVDLAVQQYLRTLLEVLVRVKRLRTLDLVGLTHNGQRTSLPIRVTSDPGARLRLIERLARAEEDKQKRLDDAELQATLEAEERAKRQEQEENEKKTKGKGKRKRDDKEAEDAESAMEMGKRIRMEQAREAEEARRAAATQDSAAALALGNVGSRSSNAADGLSQALEKRRAAVNKLQERLEQQNFGQTDDQRLNELRSRAGRLNPAEHDEMKQLAFRWDAVKKLTEHIAIFNKQIVQLQTQLAHSTQMQPSANVSQATYNSTPTVSATTAATTTSSTTSTTTNNNNEATPASVAPTQLVVDAYVRQPISLDDCRLAGEWIPERAMQRYLLARLEATHTLNQQHK